MLLFVDPGPLVADIPAAVLEPVLARCDWWSCNQREAALLTGSDDPAEAAPGWSAGPPGPTSSSGLARWLRGSHAGAWSGTGHGLSLSHVAAPAVAPVDSTGAGDVNSGVFLAGQ